MTPAVFLQKFSNFTRTSPNIVANQLEMAASEMGGPDFSVWPPFAVEGQKLTLTDLAHGYLTAHLLQTSPNGGPTRLDPKGTDGRSSYLDRFEEICRGVAGGMVVAGTLVGPGVTSSGAGSLVLEPGAGFVALVNGSLNVTFSIAQTLLAGTVLAFVGAQPGALYALAANLSGTAANLTAPYTGPTNPASRWNVGAG
jgi:hypothetical protein